MPTLAEKKTYITQHCNKVRDQILAKVNKIPADWNVFELRELIAHHFDKARTKIDPEFAEAFRRTCADEIAKRRL